VIIVGVEEKIEVIPKTTINRGEKEKNLALKGISSHQLLLTNQEDKGRNTPKGCLQDEQ